MDYDKAVDISEKNRQEIEKIKAEVIKIQAETENLKRPFILSPTTWGILATAIVGLGGFLIQLYYSDIEYKKAEVLKESALLKADQAEERTRKAEEKFVSIEAKTIQTDSKLADAQTKLAAGKTDEVKNILTEAQTINQAASTQSSQAAQQLGQSSSDLVKFTSKVAENLPVKVYPQIANESQRRKAAEISAKLKTQSFNVLPIDNVEGEAIIPTQTEVRYFRAGEHDEAEKLLKILQQDFNLTNSTIKSVSSRNNSGNTRHLEIWYSKDAF